MSGSRNTELTTKYVCRSFCRTSFELKMIVFVAYSTNAMSAKTTPRPATTSRQRSGRRPVHLSRRSRKNVSANGA